VAAEFERPFNIYVPGTYVLIFTTNVVKKVSIFGVCLTLGSIKLNLLTLCLQFFPIEESKLCKEQYLGLIGTGILDDEGVLDLKMGYWGLKWFFHAINRMLDYIVCMHLCLLRVHGSLIVGREKLNLVEAVNDVVYLHHFRQSIFRCLMTRVKCF
jgi:hypothetical protein